MVFATVVIGALNDNNKDTSFETTKSTSTSTSTTKSTSTLEQYKTKTPREYLLQEPIIRIAEDKNNLYDCDDYTTGQVARNESLLHYVGCASGKSNSLWNVNDARNYRDYHRLIVDPPVLNKESQLIRYVRLDDDVLMEKRDGDEDGDLPSMRINAERNKKQIRRKSTSKNDKKEVEGGVLESILPGTTRIFCDATRYSDVPEQFCDARDIAIKVGKSANMKKRDESSGTFNTLIGGSCELNETVWDRSQFGNGAAGWFQSAFSPVTTNTEIKCDAWIDNPLFIIERYDPNSPYHVHQDLLNTFMVYSALNLNPSTTQTILIDNRNPDGAFVSAWASLFTNTNTIMDLKSLSNQVLQHYNSTGTGELTLCLRRAIFTIHGGVSPYSRGANRPTKCKRSPLLRAYSQFVKDRIVSAANRYPSDFPDAIQQLVKPPTPPTRDQFGYNHIDVT
ncbi:hypothetical protein HDU76_008673, partial [Blyttiomyces sp. JEL0837]